MVRPSTLLVESVTEQAVDSVAVLWKKFALASHIIRMESGATVCGWLSFAKTGKKPGRTKF
jgi:hypothetical protein